MAFEIPSFIFGAGTGIESPGELRRKRSVSDALMSQVASRTPQNPWEGINSVTKAMLARQMGEQADTYEQEQRTAASEAFNGLFAEGADPSISDLANFGGNGFATDSQQSVVNALLSQRMAPPSPTQTTSINGQLVNSQTGEVLGDYRTPGGEQSVAKWGLNPVYGTDAEGNPALGQLSNTGQFQETQLPDGFNISREPIKMDAGTHFVLLDPITRQQIGIIPKENYQEAFDTAAGRTSGAAQAENTVTAPQSISNAETMLAQIDDVINDPDLAGALGVHGILPTIPGTQKAGVVAKIEQLQGAAFLQAFETLKGGGQITEVEGQKATNAIARLQRAQSEEDFVAALNDLKDVINIGLSRARSQMQQPQPQAIELSGTTSGGLTWSIEP